MGSFSWMYATPVPSKSAPLNIMPGDKVKLLIPQELGGGHIAGTYRDYGRIETPQGTVHDVYELVAIWNSPTIRNIFREYDPKLTDKVLARKARDEQDTDPAKSITFLLRCIGIDWRYGIYGDRLHYDLKFARMNDKITYELCRFISPIDPYRGFVRDSFTSTLHAEWGMADWMKRVKPRRDVMLGRPLVEPKVYDLNRLVALRALLEEKYSTALGVARVPA